MRHFRDRLIATYAATGEDTDEHFKEAIQRVRDHLHSSQSSAAVCLICLEHMKNEDAVWHCSKGCCCVLHLLCIQAWARQQLAAASYKASQDTARSTHLDPTCTVHLRLTLLGLLITSEHQSKSVSTSQVHASTSQPAGWLQSEPKPQAWHLIWYQLGMKGQSRPSMQCVYIQRLLLDAASVKQVGT